MLHEYHVIYNVQYYPWFSITVVGLGTYYLQIRRSTHIWFINTPEKRVMLMHHLLIYCPVKLMYTREANYHFVLDWDSMWQ